MENNTKKYLITAISISIVIILIVSVFIYKRIKENNAWELAKTKNSSTSYENYLKSYPEGRFKLTADSLFDEVLWLEAKKGDKFDSYQSYCKKLSKGKYVAICDSISQLLLWVEAKNSQTNSGYKKYISLFPKGRYAEEAKSIIDKYSIEAAKDWGFEMKNDMLINTKYKDFNIQKTIKVENVWASDETFEVVKFNVYENGEKILVVQPYDYDSNNNNNVPSFDYKILSEKYRTNKDVGVGSSIDQLIKAYPKGFISYEHDYEAIIENLCFWIGNFLKPGKSIYFIFNVNDLRNIDYLRNLDSDRPSPEKKVISSDFKETARVNEIFFYVESKKQIKDQILKTPSIEKNIEEKTITIKDNGIQITLLKKENSYLKEFSGRYVWSATGIWEGIPGGITIDATSITLWGSVLQSTTNDKGDYPNINGAVVTGGVLNNDGNVYSDPTGKYLAMNKFSHKIKFMNFVNRQFAGESWEYFEQRQRVLHLHRNGNTLQMIFASTEVFTMYKQ